MGRSDFYYFVEGECEKTFLRSFMFINGSHFKPGRIEVFNFINEKLSKAKARTINKDMHVVIVCDTDVKVINNLINNIDLLKTISRLGDNHIIFVPSIETFEDELVFSCSKISKITEMFNSKSLTEHKKKFINHSDISSKLIDIGFDLKKMWSRLPKHPYDKFGNDSNVIKVIKE